MNRAVWLCIYSKAWCPLNIRLYKEEIYLLIMIENMAYTHMLVNDDDQ